MVRGMLAGMRVVFWLAATLLGSGAVICALASFAQPRSGAHTILFLAAAIGMLEARDATPV